MDLHNWTMEKKLSWNIVMLRNFFLMQIRDGDMRTYCIVKQFISARRHSSNKKFNISIYPSSLISEMHLKQAYILHDTRVSFFCMYITCYLIL